VKIWPGIATVVLVWTAHAAELKPETIKAWDQYVEEANARMQERLHDDGKFLWMGESPERMRQVKEGRILTAPIGPHMPMRVTGGLIHHWIGAAFLPHVKLEDVLSTVRDYPHYKEYYAPTVIESKAVRQSGTEDQFSMVMMNKSFLMKRALDSEYQSSYVRLDAQRCYSTSTTTRVQEVEDYGQASEHRLPLNEGSGYIWRLYAITRFQEADNGVYVEVEGMALSRDIPAAVRFVVDPIVRRVSKGSVTTSLKQTGEAVSNASGRANEQAKGAPVGSDGKQLIRTFRQ
jgi:hypothetical protein